MIQFHSESCLFRKQVCGEKSNESRLRHANCTCDVCISSVCRVHTCEGRRKKNNKAHWESGAVEISVFLD